MFVLYVALPALVMIPAGIYFYFIFGRMLTIFHVERKTVLSRVLSVGLALVCMAVGWNILGLGAVILLYFLSCCLITQVLYGIGKRVLAGKEKCRKVLEFFYRSQILGLMAVLLFLLYGYFNIQQIGEKAYSLESGKTEGMRIAAITDLHLGNTMNSGDLEKELEKIEAAKPDLLVLVGDIFDESTQKAEMEAAAKAFGAVETTYGSFYVFGNHDSNHYVETPAYTEGELEQTLEAAGVKVLTDEVVEAGDFYIIGRRDASDGEREKLSALTSELDTQKFKLLLDHQPGHLADNEEAGMDLQISGHTHAGQIWPTGWLMEALHINEINYGYRQVGEMQVIVSSGIAGWGYPIRTGGHCEYLLIDVDKDK